jgi:hypothetical protein
VFLKAGDTYPPFIADTNADLTGATTLVKISKLDGSSVLSRTGVISDAPGGLTNERVTYQWVAANDAALITNPGAYRAEVLVTFAGGAVERFPQRSWLEVIVRPAIA